jgi:hypothetical protein
LRPLGWLVTLALLLLTAGCGRSYSGNYNGDYRLAVTGSRPLERQGATMLVVSPATPRLEVGILGSILHASPEGRADTLAIEPGPLDLDLGRQGREVFQVSGRIVYTAPTRIEASISGKDARGDLLTLTFKGAR